MNVSSRKRLHRPLTFACLLVLFVFTAPALAGDYAALNGVKGLKTVFDYGNGSAEMATVVFPAIRDTYQSESVTALPEPPTTIIVFHADAVNLITTERKGDAKENKTLDKVAEMIRQFKKDGVKMEVCMYAVKVMGVAPQSLLPEIDQVGNGFISVAGYQSQGFSVISVP